MGKFLSLGAKQALALSWAHANGTITLVMGKSFQILKKYSLVVSGLEGKIYGKT